MPPPSLGGEVFPVDDVRLGSGTGSRVGRRPRQARDSTGSYVAGAAFLAFLVRSVTPGAVFLVRGEGDSMPDGVRSRCFECAGGSTVAFAANNLPFLWRRGGGRRRRHGGGGRAVLPISFFVTVLVSTDGPPSLSSGGGVLLLLLVVVGEEEVRGCK